MKNFFTILTLGTLLGCSPTKSDTAQTCSNISCSSPKLADFLNRNHAELGQLEERDLKDSDFFPHLEHPISWVPMSKVHTRFFGQLIGKFLNAISDENVNTLVDLGAGNSVPTIMALIANPNHGQLQVIADDIVPEAIQASRENVRNFGLVNRYTFVQEDMFQLLGRLNLDSKSAVVVNPPYLPTPDDLSNDPRFSFASGGPDGTRFIEPLLKPLLPPGSHLILMWSSLSNPAKIISLIDKHFEVEYVWAVRKELSATATSAEIFPQIQSQAAKGMAFYDTDAQGKLSHLVIGTILRKRKER